MHENHLSFFGILKFQRNCVFFPFVLFSWCDFGAPSSSRNIHSAFSSLSALACMAPTSKLLGNLTRFLKFPYFNILLKILLTIFFLLMSSRNLAGKQASSRGDEFQRRKWERRSRNGGRGEKKGILSGSPKRRIKRKKKEEGTSFMANDIQLSHLLENRRQYDKYQDIAQIDGLTAPLLKQQNPCIENLKLGYREFKNA